MRFGMRAQQTGVSRQDRRHGLAYQAVITLTWSIKHSARHNGPSRPHANGGVTSDIKCLQMRKVVGIVDDNPTVLNAVALLLRAAGYETELFSSGDALLDRLTTSAAVCLVIDIHLGDECGIALGRRLAALGLTLPVIFMSGDGDRGTEEAAIDAGCIAFLRKPFPANLLMEAVERALRRIG